MEQEELETSASKDETNSSAKQSTKPYLLSIPPEIRLVVYRLLTRERRLIIHKHDAGLSLSGQLLRVCQKFYHEMLPVLYGSTTFVLSPCANG